MRPLMPPVQTPDNLFHDGDPSTGDLGTIMEAEHLNNVQAALRDVQAELISVLTAAGVEPNPNTFQLVLALEALFAAKSDTLGALSSLVGAADKLPYFTGPGEATLTNLTSVGRNVISQTSIANLLTYLGLGAGAPAIGIPFFWPSAAMPNSVITEWADMTFLKFNGASFSASAYPKLALIFPGLIIPEARGVFPRIWDDGRGVDAGRSLLSDQLGTFVSVDINYADNGLVGAIGTIGGDGGIANVNGDTITTPLTKTAFQYAQSTIASSTSLVTNTVATRPRNIAFNFLVRAK